MDPAGLGYTIKLAEKELFEADPQVESDEILDTLERDEDVDDEKCSPLKPKARTSEDSPFKKHQRDR